jgi:hypothetical protein
VNLSEFLGSNWPNSSEQKIVVVVAADLAEFQPDPNSRRDDSANNTNNNTNALARPAWTCLRSGRGVRA